MKSISKQHRSDQHKPASTIQMDRIERVLSMIFMVLIISWASLQYLEFIGWIDGVAQTSRIEGIKLSDCQGDGYSVHEILKNQMTCD